MQILAAENCLISVVPSILTPDMVNKMDDERLMALASESEAIRVEREYLREQLEVLEQGLQKCRRYGGRQSNGERLFPSLLTPIKLDRKSMLMSSSHK